MKVYVEPGKYVVAVSGGIDSIVLLNVLSKQAGLNLVVAHFDHGIRADSGDDRLLVKHLAEKYRLPFEYGEGKLGPGASEATAREARYKFLREVNDKHGARAIVTAHHQDDVIETAIINLLRGTGRKGLSSLASTKDLARPLLGISKQDISAYAKANKLEWHEDSTNADTKYLRNYVRHELLPKLSAGQKQTLLELIARQGDINTELDALLHQQFSGRVHTLDRQWFVALPHDSAKEVMAAWLRANGIREFDRATIERAVVGAKTASLNKLVAIKKGYSLEIGRQYLALVVGNDGQLPRK